jgi:hypothetical protein
MKRVSGELVVDDEFLAVSLLLGTAAHFLSQVVSESKSAETTGNTRLLPFLLFVR